jgi:hypothetical protein
VRVPDEAGDGKATVALSFPAWQEGRVAPTTIDVPITGPQEGDNGKE